MTTLALYVTLTFAATWSCWFAAAGRLGVAVAPWMQTLLIYLGIFSPAFVALAMTAHADGGRGVRVLLARLVHWRVAVRWYLFAALFMAAVKVTVALAYRVGLGEWPVFGQTPVFLLFAATLVSLLTFSQSGEELGWRGFALPRLSSRMGLGWGSIVLGVVWAVWHLPLFFIMSSADTHGQSFPLYLLQVVALSVAFAWLWWRADGSLLLAMLLHAAVNNTKDIVPSASAGATNVWTLSASLSGWITVSVLWVCAAVFLFDMRRIRRAPREEQ